MTTKASVLTAMLMIGCSFGTASAQQPAPAPPPSAPAAAAASSEIDVSKLPLNLNRVQRQLQAAIDREDRSGSILRYTVNVVAQAPPIVLFTPQDDLRYAPTPNSAPTHQDMINYVTPKEFSSPVMDFNNLIRWIQSRTKSKE